MTVGELKKKLKDVDDDLLIVSYQSDMEKHGIQKAHFRPEVIKVKEVKVSTYDRFDYTDYSYTTYERDENGTMEVLYM